MRPPGSFAAERHPAPTPAHRMPSRTGAAPITWWAAGPRCSSLSTATTSHNDPDRTQHGAPSLCTAPALALTQTLASRAHAQTRARSRRQHGRQAGKEAQDGELDARCVAILSARDSNAEHVLAEEELMLVRAVIDLALSNIPALVRASLQSAPAADSRLSARSVGPQGTARQLFREDGG